jgi:hypothetical protein
MINMKLSIRDLELIRDACRVVGRQRRGHPVSDELKLLHDRVIEQHNNDTKGGDEK